MRKLYLIATANAIPREGLTACLETIQGCGPWFYSIPNTTFVFSNLSANELYGQIKRRFPGDDRLFVSEAPADNIQGWIPQDHWNIIHANNIVHDYELKFEGYWTRGNEGWLPACSGVYCVYSCIEHEATKTVNLLKLLYIGRANDIRKRHMNHEKLAYWLNSLKEGETLCYSYARLPVRSLAICEAAMIFHHKPPCNEIGDLGFYHEKTRVVTSGCNRFLVSKFIVPRTVC